MNIAVRQIQPENRGSQTRRLLDVPCPRLSSLWVPIVLDLLDKYADASLMIRVDGPPAFTSGRVIIEGKPRGFRMLADILRSMADAVDDPSRPEHTGWGLVFDPKDIPQLKMSEDYMLSLSCAHD